MLKFEIIFLEEIMPETELFREISSLRTEARNANSENIDTASISEILQIINNEDKKVAFAVELELPNIERAVEVVTDAFMHGGRLFYIGAGTSGRLGILDASECPPTFGSSPDRVQGIIAGGKDAVFRPSEGAEDSFDNGAAEIDNRKVSPLDVVCGITASGRTPFVRGGLRRAKEIGAFTILIATASRESIEKLNVQCDVLICPDVGPEVIAGSTRMKSGTAQKLILNMITTASMVRCGKTLGNVMVDLQMTSSKLRERAKKILMNVCGVDYNSAQTILDDCKGHVKTAIVATLGNCTPAEARQRLVRANGFVRTAIEMKAKVDNTNNLTQK